MVIVSPGLVQGNPEAIKRYVTASVRGLRDYHNAVFVTQSGRDAIVASLSAHTALKDPQAYAIQNLGTVV